MLACDDGSREVKFPLKNIKTDIIEKHKKPEICWQCI